MVVICAGCERPILDRFLLNVLERAWHTKCVQCADCNGHLTEKCFSRDGKLFCRDDFFRRFGTKCGGCSQGISPNDLVRRARNKVFHLKCFTCMVCRKQLSTGEELYVLDENKFICKDDYLNSKYPGCSDHEDNDMDTLEQSMLDKLDDMSDKGSLPGDGEEELSRDSSLPPLTATTPGAPSGPISGAGTNSTGGPTPPPAAAVVNSNFSANNSASTTATTTPEIKQEKNNNSEISADANGGNTSDSNSTSGKEDNNKENSKGEVDENGKPATGTKRRGPRTTIKAKQLETLKAAFNATPKPTRHIREQLAQETGLNMRVIQVWFQNRRSKERRMKQLSALGARRQFFRNPRRLRALRPGEELEGDMMGQPGFNYFGENGEFYPGYPGYNDYFPGQPGDPGNMAFLPPNSGPQGSSPMVDGPLPGRIPPYGQIGPDGQFMHGDMGLPPTSSPEPHIPSMHPDGPFSSAGMPPRSMATGFNQQLTHAPPEMAQETW